MGHGNGRKRLTTLPDSENYLWSWCLEPEVESKTSDGWEIVSSTGICLIWGERTKKYIIRRRNEDRCFSKN